MASLNAYRAPCVLVFGDSEGRKLCVGSSELADNLGQATNTPNLVEVDEGFDGLALTEEIAKFERLSGWPIDAVVSPEPVEKKRPARLAGTVVGVFPPLADGGADALGDADGRRAAPRNNSRRVSWLLGSDAVGVRFIPRQEERFDGGCLEALSHQILTSSVMLVSQPKTSTTFTQAVYRPFAGYT